MFKYALLFLFTKMMSIGHTCDGAIPWLIDYTREAQKVQEPPVDYRHGVWKFIWDFQDANGTYSLDDIFPMTSKPNLPFIEAIEDIEDTKTLRAISPTTIKTTSTLGETVAAHKFLKCRSLGSIGRWKTCSWSNIGFNSEIIL